MSKKLILGLVFGLVAAPSFATALCLGDGKEAKVTAGTNFIATSFQQKCSNNVYSDYSEDATGAWIASASQKGKSYFMGHTNGGAAVPIANATVDPKTKPDTAGKLTEAEKLGASTTTSTSQTPAQ